jgi:RepB DNA-primase from phage plasmid
MTVFLVGKLMNQTAARFLRRCFAPDETIAVLLRGKNDSSPTQRVVNLETALAPRYLAWLDHENAAGANIYVAANPLRLGSRQRTKESIASIRHLYLDIDTDGDVRLATLRASDAVPPPTAILSTSPGKYQVLWRVDGFDSARQEQALKLLAIAFGGDPACTDCNRVLRIPGFLNRKYNAACLITVEYPDDSVWSPDDFRLDIDALDAMLLDCDSSPRKTSAKHSNSESDWAWVCDQLAHGKDAVKLTRELAIRRSDKPNPIYYAQRTVDVASARLWLVEGIPVDDVITMLESRRRLEIPAAIAEARAREIAATAQRMLVRRKTA